MTRSTIAWGCLAWLVAVLTACKSPSTATVQPKLTPEKIESIYWERQSEDPESGKIRLTLWQDGRSQIMVVPGATLMNHINQIAVRDGWKLKTNALGHYFLREDVFTKEETVLKFQSAIAAGVNSITPLEFVQLQGAITYIGLAGAGSAYSIAVPDEHKNFLDSKDQQRYQAVSKILSQFDTDAYYLLSFEG